jgi:hypothetical protein
MRPENLPAVEVRLVVVRLSAERGARASVQTMMSNGEWHTVTRQEWPTGRPSADQLQLICASLWDEAETSIVGAVGVQGTLLS